MTISTQRLRFLRGNTAASGAFTGLQGELIVDTDLKTIRVQDGVTAGGTLLATAAQLANVASTGNLTISGQDIAGTIANANIGLSPIGSGAVIFNVGSNASARTYLYIDSTANGIVSAHTVDGHSLKLNANASIFLDRATNHIGFNTNPSAGYTYAFSNGSVYSREFYADANFPTGYQFTTPQGDTGLSHQYQNDSQGNISMVRIRHDSNVVARFYENLTTTLSGNLTVSQDGNTFGTFPNAFVQVYSNVNSYSQIVGQNINNGTRASTDFVATADNGTDSTRYIDLGINSSTYADPAFFGDTGSKNDGYLYVVNTSQAGPYTGNGNLILGSTNGQVKFFVGNTAQANVIAQINGSGIMPGANVTYSLGSSTAQWKDLWLSNTTFYLGGTPITVANGVLSVNGSVVSGNYGDANVAVYAGNIVPGNVNLSGIGASGKLQFKAAAGTNGAYIYDSSGSVFLAPNTTYSATAGVVIGGLGYILSPNGARNITLNYNSVNGQVGVQANLVVGTTASGGNLTVANSIVASGNVTGTYFIGNGALLTGIAASSTYSNANVASFLANIGSNAIVTTGNVTAGYFIGNGALLTGISASSSYGNTNVAAYLSGNVSIGNLTANTNVTVTSNLIVGSGAGGFLFRPLVGGTGATIYSLNAAPSQTNYALSYNGASLNLNAPTGGGIYSSIQNSIVTSLTSTGLAVTGVLSATGNITGNNIVANSFTYANGVNILSGISGTYANANVAAYLPTYTGNISSNISFANGNINLGGIQNPADQSGTLINVKGIVGMTASSGANISGFNIVNAASFIGNGALLTGIVANTTYSNTNVASYLTGNITVGNISGSQPGVTLVANTYSYTFSNIGNVSFPGNLTVTANTSVGNIFATGYYYANGTAFTGTGGSSNYSNTNVASYLPTYSGNISSGNINVSDELKVLYNGNVGLRLDAINPAGVVEAASGKSLILGANAGASYMSLGIEGTFTVPGNIASGSNLNIIANNKTWNFSYTGSGTGNLSYPDGTKYSGNTVTLANSSSYYWKFNEPAGPVSDTITLSFNSLSTTLSNWYFGTDSTANTWILDSSVKSIGFSDSPGHTVGGRLTFGTLANLGNASANDIELSSVNANAYVRASNSIWKFGTDGKLTVPGLLKHSSETSELILSQNGFRFESNVGTNSTYIDGQQDALFLLGGTQGTVVGAGASTWNFDNNGNLTLPSNSSVILYPNGASILSGITGGSSNYGNANVVSMLAANTAVFIGNVGNVSVPSVYPLQSNITQLFVGNNAGITSGNGSANSTQILHNTYISANGAPFIRNTQTGAGIISFDPSGFSVSGLTSAVTANTSAALTRWITANAVNTTFSLPVVSTSSVTAAGFSLSSGSFVTSVASLNLFQTTATTINMGGAATAINMGASTGSVVVAGNVWVGGAVGNNTGTLTLRAIGTYNTLALYNIAGGYNSPPYANQSLTGGSGTGMTANYSSVGGYVSTITVSNPGTGYRNGDVLTVPGGLGTTVILSNYNSNVSNGTTVGSANCTLTLDGNLTLPGNVTYPANSAIYGDFSNNTVNNRTIFKTTTANSTTGIYAVPNGTSTGAAWQAANSSNLTNASKIMITTNGNTDVQLVSGINGSGTYLPLSFYNNGSAQMQLSVSGNLSMTANNNIIASGTGSFIGNLSGATATMTGNVSASYFVGNGALLTGISAGSSYGNANVAAFLGSYGSNAIVTTGNVDAGFVRITTGLIPGLSASPAPTISGFGLISTTGVAGNITASGNLIANADALITGNVTANYFVGNGSTLTGLVYNNIGNIYGAQPNVTLQAGSYSWTFDNTGNLVIPTTSNIVYANGAVFSSGGGGTGNYSNTNVSAFLASFGTNTISTTGNITAGNINANQFGNSTGTTATYTGNVSVGNLSVTGNIVDTGALSILSGTNSNLSLIANGTGIISVTGAIIGLGNVVTAYPTQSGITTVFIGNNTTIAAGGGSSNSASYMMNNLYFQANGQAMARNTYASGAGQFSIDGATFSWNATGSATANTAAGMGARMSLTATALATQNSVGITSAGTLTVQGASGIVTTQTTFPLLTTTATTINFGNSASVIAMGANVGSVIIGNSVGNITAGNIIATQFGNSTGTTATYTGNVTAGNLVTTGVVALSGGNVSGVGNLVGVTSNTTITANTFVTSFLSNGAITTTSNVIVTGSNAISIPNLPAFRVYGNTSTVYTGGNTIINQAIDYNQGSNYNNATGLFTAPVAGLYHCYATIRVANNNALNQASLQKNSNNSGANVIAFWETDTNTGTATHFSITGYAKCAVGDTVRLQVLVGNVQFDSNDSWGVTFIG